VYVTHDQVEALTMGDRIAVLKDGLLQQVGLPRDLYRAPVNLFVAGFIGSPAMNIFPAEVVEGGVQFGSTVVPLERSVLPATGAEVSVGVRPEDIHLQLGEGEGLSATVDLVEELGADGYIYAHAEQLGRRVEIVARVLNHAYPDVGDTVFVSAQPDREHVFDPETQQRLNGPVGMRTAAGSEPVLQS
jgi:multiple sugar transport system ATP-binding protein